ncbi:hypothetical protein GCM10010347_59400 [Streptomyces cirratus]|uniref:Uncharacterized protein n=1 Tax=Streptomyces cirratus TaxID=68187 RepID=A0ABQ3F128_9ACTN|nr:hypothetical protein GCM10010347_59400 [Streptomyces cirratus]
MVPPRSRAVLGDTLSNQPNADDRNRFGAGGTQPNGAFACLAEAAAPNCPAGSLPAPRPDGGGDHGAPGGQPEVSACGR